MSHISFAKDKFIPTSEVSLSISDNFLSVIRGYQVFTFLKTVNGGKPVFLDHHLDRVLSNAQTMNMIVKQSREEINDIINETLNHNNFDESECNLMILFAGTKATDTSGLISDSPVDLFVIITPIKICPEKYYQEGIAIGCFEDKRSNDGELKAPYNYFGGLKAQQALVQNGEYDEALYISNNKILEGTTFSFFAVGNDGKIITPKADGKILRSVTRLALLNIFKEQKIHAEETDMFIDSISSYKEAFIASSNRGVIPVRSIDRNMVNNGQVGDVTKRVMALYAEAINF